VPSLPACSCGPKCLGEAVSSSCALKLLRLCTTAQLVAYLTELPEKECIWSRPVPQVASSTAHFCVALPKCRIPILDCALLPKHKHAFPEYVTLCLHKDCFRVIMGLTNDYYYRLSWTSLPYSNFLYVVCDTRLATFIVEKAPLDNRSFVAGKKKKCSTALK